MKKFYFWNPGTCSCENCKYVRNIIGNSAVICDEIIDMTKPVPTKIISTKNVSTKSVSTKTFPTKCTSTNFYILLGFLLTTTALLIAVSIYCYLIKY